jgi:hypothetical protein
VSRGLDLQAVTTRPAGTIQNAIFFAILIILKGAKILHFGALCKPFIIMSSETGQTRISQIARISISRKKLADNL